MMGDDVEVTDEERCTSTEVGKSDYVVIMGWG